MRALIVTNMWPSPERPDRGIFVADQAAALGSLGHEVEVFHFDGGSALSYLSAALKLLKRRSDSWDIVHAHFGLSAWVALAARGKVRAVTFHGTDLEHPRSRRISAQALRFLDLPAAASPALAERIPPSHLRREPLVLPCGFSEERFQPMDRSLARSRLGLDPHELIVLLPSDPARPEKRADRAQLLADRLGARLVTLSRTHPDDVAKWINASNVVVIPSEREGFGLAALEAIACEVPVLATPVGIAPNALTGINGAFCADWDPEKWSDAARSMIAEGTRPDAKNRISQWSAVSCARKVVAAWEEALAAQDRTSVAAGQRGG